MVKSLYNTNVLTASKMLDVTDESIIAMSNGEVSEHNMFDDNDTLITNKSNLVSEEIFGKIGEKSLKMGHVHSPVPFVNIQYFRGKKPILPSILEMDRKDVEAIIYNHIFVNKETMRLLKPAKVDEGCPEGYVTGAEAIKLLLDNVGYSSDNIILNNIPVIPLFLRERAHDGIVSNYQVEQLYSVFLSHCKRYEVITSLENIPPVIAQHEKRSIQNYADRLICNGATEFPFTSFEGLPLESLQNVAEIIGDMNYQPVNSEEIINKYSSSKHCPLLKDVCKEYVELNTKDYGIENSPEYPAIPKEDQEKLGVLIEKVYSHSDLIAEEIFEDSFSEYDDYEAEFIDAARISVCDCVNNACDVTDVDDEMISDIIFGMYMQMLFLKKYRVQWLETESED